MTALVIFAHGKESGPWGSKIRYLATIAEHFGARVISPDYTDLSDLDVRVRRLLDVPLNTSEPSPLVLVGFPPNQWGLHEMHGNVGEWVQDEWHPNYNGAPDDGRPWVDGQFPLRILRGGTFYNSPFGGRSAKRARGATDGKNLFIGFRVARTLKPIN